MSSRRPSRPGGPPRGHGNSPSSGGDDSPAQTNLGLILQRAMEAAQQTAQAADPQDAGYDESEAAQQTKLCANCWNAITFKNQTGRAMARCAKDLWIKPAYTLEELNTNKIRRWFVDCPEYDDSE